MPIIASFTTSIDQHWLRVPTIKLARRATHDRTADRYVLVTDAETRLRCDIFLTEPECFAFEDIRIWHRLLLVGWGSTVYCVDLNTSQAFIYPLGDYFGSFAVTDEYCLCSSGSQLIRFGRGGRVLWRSAPIAVDGITIASIEGDTIKGDAEQDPPGGWQPFALSLTTGK